MRASRRWRLWSIGAGLALALMSTGCGGYWPLRWPERDLWAAIPGHVPSLQVPAGPLKDYSHQLTQDGVAVGLDWLGPAQAREIFHVDLARNGIQPLLVAIQNMSGQSYRLRKSEMGLRAIPASRVAALACPHPVRTLARHVKWLAFLIPGFVFETVVEPTSTLDFPIMREVSRRPSASGCRDLREDFIRRELADGEIAPGEWRSGVVFVPPVRLGSTVSITLAPAGTQEKAVWVFPTPPPIYSRTERYAHSPTVVWDAMLKAVGRIASWRIRLADRDKGTIDVRKGWRRLPGSSYTSIMVTMAGTPPVPALRSALIAVAAPDPLPVPVKSPPSWRHGMPGAMGVRPLRSALMAFAAQEAGAGLTRVSIETPLPRPTSVHYGEHSRTIDRFFRELARELPSPPPKKPATPPLAPAASRPADQP